VLQRAPGAMAVLSARRRRAAVRVTALARCFRLQCGAVRVHSRRRRRTKRLPPRRRREGGRGARARAPRREALPARRRGACVRVRAAAARCALRSAAPRVAVVTTQKRSRAPPPLRRAEQP
jgi:hypothetical protein